MSQPKRYTTFSDELKCVFGCKVHRISVDAGFTCPNRDGLLDTKGCIFCGGDGSGSFGIRRELDIAAQLEDGKEVMRRKYRSARFIAYFQAYTNTYSSPDQLRKVFGEALTVADIVGVIVATRPDCLADEILEYLAELNRQTYLWLEIGLQSIHNKTLSFINRRHDHESSIAAIERAKSHKLRVCAHIILGLPGETREEMLSMAVELNRLGVDGVKIHLLHVMKGTELARLYERGEVSVMGRDDYAGLVCDFLELLNPQIMIHRLTGDGGREQLIAPLWSLKKFEIINLIDAELARRGTRQGSFFPTSQPA